MDKNVIPRARPFRDILVKGVIVPVRSEKSAKKYRKIWTEEGSPLLVNTINLQKKLQARLGDDWKVIIGMRYSKPSMKQALDEIKEHPENSVYFIPLYPHYAQATVYSSLEKLKQISSKEVKCVDHFFDKDWFISAQNTLIKKHFHPQSHLLISYHGLPISQEFHADISYQKQCLQTSKHIQEGLQLSDEQVSTGFQSRVGVKKWIGPSTEEVMQSLAKKGVKHLTVVCPSFVADCLETLEEIGMELKENFLKAGGEKFNLIPCLNDDDLFVSGIISEIQK
jgi:ferrochelatase